jgi:hypothetical protein
MGKREKKKWLWAMGYGLWEKEKNKKMGSGG